ncbi:DNA polymerase III subunit delta' [Rothia sp. P13129]|uniref:DNA polymerase III subunit delta' n=1 Tax=Rothia sp. P13129 TaxID=3402664 RepID=UPI003AC50367
MSIWDTLIGQPEVVEQLRQQAQLERPTHAWLFTGPPGSGRSTAARAFAASLLCEEPNTQLRGCGVCKTCHSVLRGTHADLTHFSTENISIKIEQARELVTKAQDRPAVGRWRIIIVEDADRMPERTSNVLLKAIEEPPEHTIWILCAPSPVDVLVTIRSRCRPVTLRVPDREEVVKLLAGVEGYPEALARHCASLAQGHIGVARHLAQSDKARQRREQVVRMPIFLSSVPAAMHAAQELVNIAQEEADHTSKERHERELQELLRTLGITEDEKITPNVKAQIRQLEEEQKRRSRRMATDTLDRFLIDLQTVFRDVLTIQLGTGSALINTHLTAELHDYAQRMSPEQALGHLDTLTLTRKRISTNASAKLAFEAMMCSFIQR